jgi:hypothetical protein
VAGQPEVGAVVTFVGLMRDINEGAKVTSMTLEHYPGMTEKALAAIAGEAAGRWDLDGISILHRVGHLKPAGSNRFRGCEQPASRGCLQSLRVSDRLPQDPGTLLEERANRSR